MSSDISVVMDTTEARGDSERRLYSSPEPFEFLEHLRINDNTLTTRALKFPKIEMLRDLKVVSVFHTDPPFWL
jgi:hypothetical protein